MIAASVFYRICSKYIDWNEIMDKLKETQCFESTHVLKLKIGLFLLYNLDGSRNSICYYNWCLLLQAAYKLTNSD